MAMIDKEAVLADIDYYISAKKLIEDILDARGVEIETVPKLIRLIKAQPRQEQKTGRWQYVYKWAESEPCGVCCSVCERQYKTITRFCPHCGARMENPAVVERERSGE